jgi:ATP-dependent Zn protease
MFVFILPLALIQLTLRAAFPVYQGWSDFFIWFMYFIYGYFLVSDPWLAKALQKQGMVALAVGIASLGALLVTMYGPGFLKVWESTPGYSLKSGSQSNESVTYSTFVAQVNANNVQSVTIIDYAVTGVFKAPVLSLDGTTKSTQFTTTVHQFGNSDLIALLQEHHVAINVQPSGVEARPSG